MLWLYIVAPIAALLLYILFAPAGLLYRLSKDGNAVVYICYGIIRFKIKKQTPEKKEKKKQKKEAKKQRKELKEQKKQEKKKLKKSKKAKGSNKKGEKKSPAKSKGIKERIKDGGITFIIDVLGDIGKIIAYAGHTIQRHLHLDIRELDINIGNEDPATVGQTYGYICAAVYPLLNLFKTLIKLNVNQLRINPDFITGKINASCNIKLWIIPAFALKFAFGLLRRGIKIYSKYFVGSSEKSDDKVPASKDL